MINLIKQIVQIVITWGFEDWGANTTTVMVHIAVVSTT